MESGITISIVTVVYNAKDNLKKTLSSIRAQSYDHIEFIIVDGASTDGSIELIKENEDIVDVFISEPDRGLYFAMNKGKNLANGDFVLFFNAGDEFVSETAIEQMALRMTDSQTLYYGNTIIFFDDTYRVAPKRHHQSVFFPKSYYIVNDYNSEKYKVTAEGDYILRSLNAHKDEHLDVDIGYSRIDGFRVHRYNSINGMRMMYGEVTALMKEHSGKVPLSYKISYPIKSLIKFIAFKIGGLPMVARILLHSYKETKRQYSN